MDVEERALAQDEGADLKDSEKANFTWHTKPQLKRSAELRGLDTSGTTFWLNERLIEAEKVRYAKAIKLYKKAIGKKVEENGDAGEDGNGPNNSGRVVFR